MIEVIVVIAIIAVFAGMGLWMSMDYYRGYSFRSKKDIFLSSLQKARLAAMLNMNEKKHGVYIEEDRYIIYEGDSYVAGDPMNREIDIGGGVDLAGNPPLPQDVSFDQLSGDTPFAGSFTMGDGARSSTISIANNGQINW